MSGDEEFGHFLPVLRRIIILVAVITAIPVVLWTITAFVRTYVSPPKIPTYRQLAATASINTPSNPGTKEAASSPPQAVAEEAKSSPPLSVTVEARATPTDTRDAGAAPKKGPFLGDRPPDSAAEAAGSTSSSPGANTPTMDAAAASAPAVTAVKMPDTASATSPAAKPADAGMPAASAAADNTPTSIAAAVQQPTAIVAAAATAGPPADAAPAMPAAEPLSGPVPLPRHRPYVAAAIEPVAAAGTTRMAAAGPIPMPRPRPEAAGPGAPADDSSGGPLDFIQNLLGGKQ